MQVKRCLHWKLYFPKSMCTMSTKMTASCTAHRSRQLGQINGCLPAFSETYPHFSREGELRYSIVQFLSATRAQFHRADKQTNLLSMKFLPSIKTNMSFHVILRMSKQQRKTVTGNMQQMEK